MASVNDVRNVTDKILQDNKDVILHIPLEDLVWAIVSFSYHMSYIEEEMFTEARSEQEHDTLLNQREYLACRRDEIARIIGQYTSFDTQKIWDVIKEEGIFHKY